MSQAGREARALRANAQILRKRATKNSSRRETWRAREAGADRRLIAVRTCAKKTSCTAKPLEMSSRSSTRASTTARIVCRTHASE